MKPSGARTAAEAARQQRRQIQFQVPNRTRSQEVSVRCRQSRACSTRHTSSYSPVILSRRPGALLSPSHTRGATASYPARRPARAIAPRSPAPCTRTPFYCQHLTSPPPPSSSCLGSPAHASTWTVLIGRRGTLTRPLSPRMWPNPTRGGRAWACERTGPKTERAPCLCGGRGAAARLARVVLTGMGDSWNPATLGSGTSCAACLFSQPLQKRLPKSKNGPSALEITRKNLEVDSSPQQVLMPEINQGRQKEVPEEAEGCPAGRPGYCSSVVF